MMKLDEDEVEVKDKAEPLMTKLAAFNGIESSDEVGAGSSTTVAIVTQEAAILIPATVIEALSGPAEFTVPEGNVTAKEVAVALEMDKVIVPVAPATPKVRAF